MAWHLQLSHIFFQAAIGGSILLILAWLSLRWCKQPVHRVRLIEFTLVGCLLVPICSQFGFLPQWSLGLIQDSETNVSPLIVEEKNLVEIRSLPNSGIGTSNSLLEKYKTSIASKGLDGSGTENLSKIGFQGDSAPNFTSAGGNIVSFPEPSPRSNWATLSTILVTAWIAIAGYLAFRWLWGVTRLRRLIRSSSPVSNRVREMFDSIAGQKGKSVRVWVANGISHPLTFGWLRPVILVPELDCRPGQEDALRFGLAHEWSHVERRDICRWHLASLVQFLFFWQPLFWWVRKQLRLGQDYLADALAVNHAQEPEDYAEYLVRAAKQSLGLPVEVALGVADRRSHLYRRVMMLISQAEPLARRCSLRWTLTTLVFALFTLGIVSSVRLDAGDTPKKESAPEEKSKPEAKKDEKPKVQPRTYTGKVSGKVDGKPIEGATVTVRRQTTGSIKYKEKEEIIEETKHKTDKNGKYTFTIPPEQVAKFSMYIELDVEAPGYAPQSNFGYSLGMIMKNEEAGERPFFEDVRLRPAKEITGTIELPDGKPAQGVRVLAYSRSGPNAVGEEFEYGSFAETLTNEKGQYSLWITTPGQFVYWILPKDYAPSLHIPKPSQRGELGRYVLKEGTVLKGKIVDTEGKPIANTYIEADREDRDETLGQLSVADSIGRGAITNEKGEFTFRPLPSGKYTIKPSEYLREPSEKWNRNRKKVRLQHVFLPQSVQIKEGEKPDPIEVRAYPHVVIQLQYLNSKGEPSGGHEPMIHGEMDGKFWHTTFQAQEKGKMEVKVPHGLENVQMDIIDNEHNSLRHRRGGKDKPLQRGRFIQLGTVDKDILDIEIVRYTAPILLVKVKTKDGEKLDPKDIGLVGNYPPNDGPGIGFSSKGRPTDINFERQNDGRYRSSQVVPDEEVTLTAFAEGYKDAILKLKGEEGKTREMELILEKDKK